MSLTRVSAHPIIESVTLKGHVLKNDALLSSRALSFLSDEFPKHAEQQGLGERNFPGWMSEVLSSHIARFKVLLLTRVSAHPIIESVTL